MIVLCFCLISSTEISYDYSVCIDGTVVLDYYNLLLGSVLLSVENCLTKFLSQPLTAIFWAKTDKKYFKE